MNAGLSNVWVSVGEWPTGRPYLRSSFFFLQVMDNTEIHVVPNILMMVGLASIGTNWFASRVCQDSLDASRFPRWKVLLLAWYAGAALLCCLLFAVVVLSYALQGRLEESLKVGYTIRGGITLWQVRCQGLRRYGLSKSTHLSHDSVKLLYKWGNYK